MLAVPCLLHSYALPVALSRICRRIFLFLFVLRRPFLPLLPLLPLHHLQLLLRCRYAILQLAACAISREAKLVDSNRLVQSAACRERVALAHEPLCAVALEPHCPLSIFHCLVKLAQSQMCGRTVAEEDVTIGRKF